MWIDKYMEIKIQLFAVVCSFSNGCGLIRLIYESSSFPTDPPTLNFSVLPKHSFFCVQKLHFLTNLKPKLLVAQNTRHIFQLFLMDFNGSGVIVFNNNEIVCIAYSDFRCNWRCNISDRFVDIFNNTSTNASLIVFQSVKVLIKV